MNWALRFIFLQLMTIAVTNSVDWSFKVGILSEENGLELHVYFQYWKYNSLNIYTTGKGFLRKEGGGNLIMCANSWQIKAGL